MERRQVVLPQRSASQKPEVQESIETDDINQTEEQIGAYFATVKKPGLEYIPSGSTLQDCVLGGGWPLGRMSNIVGDKSTGKTLLAIEACTNFNLLYPDGQIIYLEAEAAFDTDYANALGMPVDCIDFCGDSLPDFTIEAWYEHLSDVITKITKTEQPCLYIVDSLDALSDRAEKERAIDKGTYGAAKPKLIGELFRRLVKEIERTRMHLMIISQLRDKIGVMFGDKTTRTGGRAMDFYASQILWLAQIKKLEKTVRKQKRTYGTVVKAKCKKNKVGLPFRECEFPILFGYGIDDITSMITWLETLGDKDEILAIIKKPSYRSVDEVAENIKNLSKTEKLRVLNELQTLVIDEWEQIETNFLPTTQKY